MFDLLLRRRGKSPPHSSLRQVEIHPLWRNDRTVAFCNEHGIHVTAYAPLGSPAGGALFPRPPGCALLEHPLVTKIAANRGVSSAQVLVRWALQKRPASSVLVGWSGPEHLRNDTAVLGWALTDADMVMLDHMTPQHRIFRGDQFVSPDGPYKSLADLWDEGEWAYPRTT